MEYLGSTNQRTQHCKMFSMMMNDFFTVFIQLIRIGPVCKIDANSFAPIVMMLNFIAATITDKKAGRLKILNPRSCKWNPLHIAGLVFDSVVALIDTPLNINEALKASMQTTREFRRS